MITLLKIAWRNIWRNKLRSFAVFASVALGLWAGIFATSLANGLNQQRVSSVIENQLAHIQIHQNGFKENFEISKTINNIQQVEESLQQNKNIKAYTTRTIVSGMVNSASSSKAVQIKGIVPKNEAAVIDLEKFMVEGEYFGKAGRTPSIVLGQTLANKLNVKIRKKLILKFQDANNEVIAAAFKVKGIYKTVDTRADEMTVYVEQQKLNELLGFENQAHEIAIKIKDLEQLASVTPQLKATFPKLLVESWKEVFPGLDTADKLQAQTSMLLLYIIMLALCFGILNTMLMVVLERVREFGMLMAVGMNKVKVFFMVMFETVFLMLTATPVGLAMAWLTVWYFSKYGLDFSGQSDGLGSMGIDPIVYPSLTYDYYPKVILLVVIAAILSAIYPAIRAVRLNPAESIRKI